jgi:hypothetical protein
MRRTLESRDSHRNGPDDSARNLLDDAAHDEVRNLPKPRELFFEAGIVLGAALGLCVGVDVVLTILGIPDVY